MLSATTLAQQALMRALGNFGNQADPRTMDWRTCDALAAAVDRALQSGRRWHRYAHRYRSVTGANAAVPLAYTSRGEADGVLVCAGGIANAAQRFDFLAADLAPQRRIIALDWAGRGGSGWLVEAADYGIESYVDQLAGLIGELDAGPVDILGSSIGGSAAICLAARRPELVRRLVLNDSGTFIARDKRARRAEIVARHYVFPSPRQLFRRAGAAQKNVGPVPDAVLLHNVFHQTRWSDEEEARVYRHDLRALIEYRAFSQTDLDLAAEWREVRCPVLVLHGRLSDALTADILEEMRAIRPFACLQIPGAGHTPALSSAAQIAWIGRWLARDQAPLDWQDLPPDPPPHRRLFVADTL